jgi:alpha-glucosidase
MFGKIKSYKRTDHGIEVDFEEGSGQIGVVTDSIINVFAGFETSQHFSKAITGEKSVDIEFDVNQENDMIKINTGKLIVEVTDDFKVDFYDISHKAICTDYRGAKVSVNSWDPVAAGLAALEGHNETSETAEKKIQIIKTMTGEEAFYGLGDKTGFLNKRGYEYEMWNTDDPSPQVDYFKALYKSIPFFITLTKQHVYGIFFDNHYRTYFNMGKESDDYYYFAADEGNLDYYFIYGEEMPEIISGYTYLTGTTPLPQLWTLGYHQSRWSYMSEEEVLNIADHFRELGIPCDAIHLDIDYMDGYKIFTWNEETFPKPEEMMQKLDRNGFKVVTIIDPGIKIEKGYTVYDEGVENGYFAKDKEGNIYENAVWPGPAVYPDFSDERVRNWWGDLQKTMLDKGVRGIWNDMNEPASFNGQLPDDVQFSDDGRGANHKKIHNVYGHLMAKATFDGLRKHDARRPFIITRACYSGSQKYATGWTGDNQSIWAHLQMAVPQLCNLGMSGMAFIGTDVGGFGSDCTKELLCRWVQVGCFSPLFRNHCNIMGRRQEPWAYDQETLEINRKYIKLHYKLLPYLYDLFWECENNGLPVIRPLIMENQQDENVREMNDEFLFGSRILVAPVVNQGQRVRSIYLPDGEWIDYWTKETLIGGRHIIKETPLDVCPVYVKSGSLLPCYPDINYVGEKEIDELTLESYSGAGKYQHYQDNGEDYDYQKGIYNEYCFTVNEDNVLKIELNHHGYQKIYKSFRLNYNGRERILPFQGEAVITDLKTI